MFRLNRVERIENYTRYLKASIPERSPAGLGATLDTRTQAGDISDGSLGPNGPPLGSRTLPEY